MSDTYTKVGLGTLPAIAMVAIFASVALDFWLINLRLCLYKNIIKSKEKYSSKLQHFSRCFWIAIVKPSLNVYFRLTSFLEAVQHMVEIGISSDNIRAGSLQQLPDIISGMLSKDSGGRRQNASNSAGDFVVRYIPEPFLWENEFRAVPKLSMSPHWEGVIIFFSSVAP